MVDRITAEKEIRGMVHDSQSKMNGINDNIQKRLADQGLEIYRMKYYIGFLRLIFKIIGIGIILFDIIKDGISGQYRHAEGMGWMQWGLLIAGIALLAIGIYRPERQK